MILDGGRYLSTIPVYMHTDTRNEKKEGGCASVEEEGCSLEDFVTIFVVNTSIDRSIDRFWSGSIWVSLSSIDCMVQKAKT